MTFEGGTFVVQCFGEHFCDLSGSQDQASRCQENAKAVVALVRILCRRQKHVISHELNLRLINLRLSTFKVDFETIPRA